MKRTILTALAVGLLFGPAVRAQEQEEDSGRGVARLSLLNGDVSVRRGDSGDWVAAAVNAPLVVGDHVLTGSGSRAEIQFDWANLLRLSSNTDVRLATLENRRYQVQVAQGTVTMAVIRDSDADVEIDTPSVSVRPVRRGDYRVTVFENGESEVTVRSGEVEVYTPRGVERVGAGRTMLVRGTPSDPEYQIVDARSRDDWDRWNEERDRRLDNVKSYAYVSRDIYGAGDLDAYGRWIYAPPYGYVWSPSGVGPGWAPYRDGRWAWVDYYGWTWIGYEPWGWAPYHYGRWFNYAPYGWCWYPGGRYARHYWRPALVAFFGFNVGPVSVGIGFGRVGWVPLAPYEPYYPWYGRHFYHGYRGGGYWGNGVRIVNNTTIVNKYRNARVANGVTGIDYGDFTRGRRGRAIGHDEIRNRRANLVQGALPIAPSRDSQRLSDREMRMNTAMRPTNRPERFFTRNRPAQVDRVSFDDQRRGMENLTRRTLGDRAAGRPARTPVAAGRRDTAPPRAGTARTPEAGRGAVRSRVAEQAGAGGWRRTSEPADRGRQTTESNNGWRRFGSRPAERIQDPGRARPDTSPNNFGAQGRDAGDGWRRFGGRSDAGPAVERSQPQRIEQRSAPRYEAPQRSRPQRSESPRWSGANREPVRINPPIVRERGGSNSRGGGVSSSRGGNYSRGGGVSSSRGGNYSRGGGVSSSRGGNNSRGGGVSSSRGQARSSGGSRGQSRSEGNRGRGRGR